jgi:YidC/Oxa1 family membrane protein insertase
MDNARLFLGIALVFVLFLIWQAWIGEQISVPPPQSDTAAPAEPSSAGAAPPAPASGPGVAPVPAATDTPAATVRSEGERVTIYTDEVVAQIDTAGGGLRVLQLRQYPVSLEQPDQPFTLLSNRTEHWFVAQVALHAPEGPAPGLDAVWKVASNEYRLAEGQNTLQVPLSWESEGLKVTRTYTFTRNSFVIGVNQTVENATGAAWSGYQDRRLQRIRPPQSGGGGLFPTSTQEIAYTGAVISTPEERYEKFDFDDMESAPLNRPAKGGWGAMIQHYFVAAWVPPAEENNRYYSIADKGFYSLGVTGPLSEVANGDSAVFSSSLFAGPKLQDRLEAAGPNLKLTVDYGKLTILSQPLFWLLKTIHSFVGNWGWSIVLLVVVVKAVFFKLSETSYRSMANMRRLQPKLQSLREKYGQDKQKLNQAMMEMYKTEKINPLGGCLPIAVQIPVFIALYWVLLESVELRQAPFMLWIEDLSVKDPYFVLPIIMGVSMFIQQRLNPAPPDPIQARIMMALPIVFTFFFLWFPAGLVVYWVVNNVLSIAQQWVITQRVEKAAATARK